MTNVEEGTKACEDSANMENERKEGGRSGGRGRVIAGETKRELGDWVPWAGCFSCCEDNLGQARLKIFIKLHARFTYDRFDSH